MDLKNILYGFIFIFCFQYAVSVFNDYYSLGFYGTYIFGCIGGLILYPILTNDLNNNSTFTVVKL